MSNMTWKSLGNWKKSWHVPTNILKTLEKIMIMKFSLLENLQFVKNIMLNLLSSAYTNKRQNHFSWLTKNRGWYMRWICYEIPH